VKYVLHYFDGRGRGELLRLIFHAGNVKFEDRRYKLEEWAALKDKIIFGQLPVLEIEGHQVPLNQSIAIGDYLAKEFGLAGKNAYDHARALAFVGTIADAIAPLSKIYFEKDDNRRKQLIEEYRSSTLSSFLPLFENYLKLHADKSGFIVGDKLSWADLAFADFWDKLGIIGADDLINKSALFSAHRNKILAIPAIKSYLESRPKTPF